MRKVSARGWCANHYRNNRLYGSPTATHPRYDPAQIKADRDAFWHLYVDKSGGPNACWPWLRKLTDKGYGQMRGYDSAITAYRFGYELLVGPVPDGLQLDHLCHDPDTCMVRPAECPHRACCNPAHLKPVRGVTNRVRGDTSRPGNRGLTKAERAERGMR